jgi:hypothetical protein
MASLERRGASYGRDCGCQVCRWDQRERRLISRPSTTFGNTPLAGMVVSSFGGQPTTPHKVCSPNGYAMQSLSISASIPAPLFLSRFFNGLGFARMSPFFKALGQSRLQNALSMNPFLNGLGLNSALTGAETLGGYGGGYGRGGGGYPSGTRSESSSPTNRMNDSRSLIWYSL